MKTLEHCLLTFFETYYVLNPHIFKPSIVASSPANKLKCIIDQNNFATEPLAKTDKETDYKQRKDKATEGFTNCIEWCTIRPELKTLYTDLKKQNDLADCVLQAVFELQTYATNFLKHLNAPKKEPKPRKPRQAKPPPNDNINVNDHNLTNCKLKSCKSKRTVNNSDPLLTEPITKKPKTKK